MKLVLLLCVIFTAAVVRTEAEASSEEEEVFREEYCNEEVNPRHPQRGECASRRCNKDNTKSIGIGCPEARCSGEPIGYKGDPDKPYPECCVIPICDESSE